MNFLSAFIEGLGHLPASKISDAGTAENRDFFTERVLLSYACYSTYPLISTTTESCFLPKSTKKKRCNFQNCNVYFTSFVQFVFDIFYVCFFTFLSLLFGQYMSIVLIANVMMINHLLSSAFFLYIRWASFLYAV